MDNNARRLLRTTYAFGTAGLATLIVLIAASFWFVAKTQSATDAVLHSREQISVLADLLSTVLDAETGQRGYLLTGEPRYLQPYEDASREVKSRFAAVDAIFQNDASAQQSLAQIHAAVDVKLHELAQTVELKKSGKSVEALAIVNGDRGKQLMDRIRELVAQQSRQADQALKDNIEEQRENASRARLFAFGVVFVMLLAALGAIATIVKYTRELISARTELETLNAGLEERVKERTADLKRANEEIQRFAYIVSHDLRAPLVNVMGYTSELEASLQTLGTLAEDPHLDALASAADVKSIIATDLPESIGFIRSSTKNMDGLIKAILKLSREGQRVITPEKIQLDDFFNSVAASAQHRVVELEGEIVVAKPLPVIESDRLALEQIFSNLIDNALKYRLPGRTPHIVIRQVSSGWGATIIEVEDNGRGISPEDQERVFDLFRRAGAQDQPGEGIGLAHVRALVRRLGGEITMTSELGRGTKFRVILPKTLQSDTERAGGKRG
jgi:signal transduction histidine kinase